MPSPAYSFSQAVAMVDAPQPAEEVILKAAHAADSANNICIVDGWCDLAVSSLSRLGW